VIQGSGAPGSDPVIRLRGATASRRRGLVILKTAALDRGAGPLVVVDGTITHYSLATSARRTSSGEVVKGAAASCCTGPTPRTGWSDLHQRGDRLPTEAGCDGAQRVRPVVPPSNPLRAAHPYLTADSAYTDASGSAVLKGDSSTATANWLV